MSNDPRVDPSQRLWPLVLACALLVVVQLAVAFVIVMFATAAMMAGQSQTPSPAAVNALLVETAKRPEVLLASGVVTGFSFLFTAIIAARLSPTRLVERLRLGGTRWTAKQALLGYSLAALGTLAAGEAPLMLFTLVTGELPEAFATFGASVRGASGLFSVALFFVVVAVAPISEELFFRGYIQTRTAARVGRVGGIAIAAFLFGLVHLDPAHIVFAFFIGLFLGFVVEHTGSIRPAIFAHVVNNLLSFVVTKLGLDDPPGPLESTIVLVLSALAFAGAIVGLRRLMPIALRDPQERSRCATAPTASVAPAAQAAQAGPGKAEQAAQAVQAVQAAEDNPVELDVNGSGAPSS